MVNDHSAELLLASMRRRRGRGQPVDGRHVKIYDKNNYMNEVRMRRGEANFHLLGRGREASLRLPGNVLALGLPPCEPEAPCLGDSGRRGDVEQMTVYVG
jgi:hypothetical protein